MKKVTAAAQFTEITLEEMEKYLKRAFRAMTPTQGTFRGEVYYDLELSDVAVIRVFTSIGPYGQSAGVGADAIRVGLINRIKNRPLKPGKWPIVKRTQGWRDNLKDRVEEAVEQYHSKEDDIEAGRFVNW